MNWEVKTQNVDYLIYLKSFKFVILNIHCDNKPSYSPIGKVALGGPESTVALAKKAKADDI